MQHQTHEDGSGSAQGQFSAGGDDFRFGGQAGVGQLSGGTRPQTGNIEEFPPLGGGAGDVGPDQRTGMIQNAAAYPSNTNPGNFPGLGQTRNGLSSPIDGQQDRSINSAVGGRGLMGSGGVARTPFELMRGNGGGGLQDVDDRNGNGRPGQTLGNLSFVGSQLPIRGGEPGSGQRPQQNQFEQNFDVNPAASPSAPPLQHKKLADMTEAERYGLPGLLGMIPLESPDHSSLAVGQDLTVLGLDLSRPE